MQNGGRKWQIYYEKVLHQKVTTVNLKTMNEIGKRKSSGSKSNRVKEYQWKIKVKKIPT